MQCLNEYKSDWILCFNPLNNFILFRIKFAVSVPNQIGNVCLVIYLKMLSLLKVLVLFSFVLTYHNILGIEMVFDRVESIKELYVPEYYNMSIIRINKINRTTYVFNVNVEFFVDIDDEYEMEVKIYYNWMNNNQYNLSPLRAPKEKYCDFIKKYLSVVMQSEKITNFPKEGTGYCPLKKVLKKASFIKPVLST